MIIKLSNGKEIVIGDAIKDTKTEAVEWLRKYKARKVRRQAVPGSPPGGSPAPVGSERSMGK